MVQQNQDPDTNTGSSAASPEEPTASPTSDKDRPEDKEQVGKSEGDQAALADEEKKELQRLRSEEGRLKKEQEEKKKLEERLQSISSWAAKDPRRYKEALMETSGFTEEQAEQYVKQAYPEWKSSKTEEDKEDKGAQSGASVQPVDPLTALASQRAIEREKEEILEGQKAFKEFTDKYEEDLKTLNQIELDSLAGMAGSLVRKSKGQVSHKEALDLVYKRNFKTEELLKDAKEQGETQGLATASSIASSTMSSPTGAARRTEEEPHVPEEEWKAAQEAGFTDKVEYLEITKSSASRVE